MDYLKNVYITALLILFFCTMMAVNSFFIRFEVEKQTELLEQIICVEKNI